jgi:cell division transport system permease protein
MRDSLVRLRRTPFASLMTVLVIGVALAMPAILQMFVQNARAATGRWDSAVDLSAYLATGIEVQQRDALVATLAGRADVAGVTVIDSDAALADFREHSGFGDALDALDSNPLPTTLVITPAPAHRDSEALAALAAAVGEIEGVELVQLDTEWVKRFHAMLDVVRRATLLAGILLAVAVLVIVGNTIRMEIQHRREEIEIVKLIGASDGFIRRPFLYSGLWYGLAGGLMAAFLVLSITQALGGPVARLSGLYGSDFALQGLSLRQFAALAGAGAALGLVGSWITTTRHMRRIEPS